MTGLLGVFDPATEAIYERWFLKRTWPATRVILWISVATWVIQPTRRYRGYWI